MNGQKERMMHLNQTRTSIITVHHFFLKKKNKLFDKSLKKTSKQILFLGLTAIKFENPNYITHSA